MSSQAATYYIPVNHGELLCISVVYRSGTDITANIVVVIVVVITLGVGAWYRASFIVCSHFDPSTASLQ